MTNQINFPACGICESLSWSVAYRGSIRDGAKKNAVNSVVQKCGVCGVERLAESACKQFSDYSDQTYREELKQSHNRSEYYQAHRQMLNFNLGILLEYDLLDKRFVDVGCGGGIVLDTVRGLVSDAVGIEPNRDFGSDLLNRGIEWFETAEQAQPKYGGSFDIALSSQVIEHVAKPTKFLAEIFALLKPGGLAIISTPNRDDILMDLASASFAPHFYRTQHRWMFDQRSLSTSSERAGFEVEQVRFVHRYGFSNAMKWVAGAPQDYLPPSIIEDKNLDSFWRTWVESSGRSDNLVAILRKPV